MVRCPLARVRGCSGWLRDGLQTHSNMPCWSQHEWLTKHNELFKWERVWKICLFWSGQGVLLQTLQEQGLWKKSMSYLLMFSRSVESDSAIPRTAACQASLSITISQSFRKLLSIESVMPSNHLILCRSLLLLPSIFPSIRVFSNDELLTTPQ